MFNDFSWKTMAMTAMNMVSLRGFSGGRLSFKKMSAGGRLCTSQENPHFWVPTIKDRPPDDMPRTSAMRGPCHNIMVFLPSLFRDDWNKSKEHFA
jgi:hypothetical protein